MHYPPRRISALLALCGVAGACSSNGTAPASTGSMMVTVSAANGATPAVVVRGPNGYAKTITSTQTVTGLAAGTYVIVADTAVAADSVVGSIIDTSVVTGSPASVTTGATAAVDVQYAMKYRLGGMWVANNDASAIIPDFSANQLRASGTIVPAETLTTQVSGPAGLAIDANGTLWESSFSGNTLLGYTPAARNTGSAPTITITSPSFQIPECLAFDGHGNLWVADFGAGLLEFTPSQLAASGTQTANVVITPGSVMMNAEAIAFDANGNAWVADESGNLIVEFTAAQLASSAVPAPADTINTGAPNSGIGFDANGNLWVVTFAGTALEYTPAQLTAGGAPNPTVTITLPSGTAPFGMAFDHRGTLWISDYANDLMLGLTAAELASSGSPTPAVTDSLNIGYGFAPEQPVFDPYAMSGGAMGTAKGLPHVVSAGHVRAASRNPALLPNRGN